MLLLFAVPDACSSNSIPEQHNGMKATLHNNSMQQSRKIKKQFNI
jgi:hypothetical protein